MSKHKMGSRKSATTLSSGISASVSIKNATFGAKRSLRRGRAHNPSCYSCSNFPSFHGSPWRGRGGRDTQRGRGEGESGVLMGAPPSQRLLSLHNQLCCFQPCFELSRSERNSLALILETLQISRRAENALNGSASQQDSHFTLCL